MGRAREKTIYHLNYENIGLVLVAQPQASNLQMFDCAFLSNCYTDTNIYRRGGPVTFPLYLYQNTKEQLTIESKIGNRTPNLNNRIINKIADVLGLSFIEEKEKNEISDLRFRSGVG